MTHVPVLFASQRLWLAWIAERFGLSVAVTSRSGSTFGGGRCRSTNFTSAPFPTEDYQTELGYYLELATQAYQVA